MLATALQAASAVACELRVQVPTLESYSQRNAQGEPTGYAVEVSREALRRVGCSARFVDFPGARSVTALAAGKIDLLYGVLPLPERRPSIGFIGPVDHMRMALYVRRDALPEGGIEDLGDVRGTTLRIGVERLLTYGPEYDALLDDPEFVDRLRIVVSRDTALEMLASGRLDGLFADAASARRFAPVVVRAVPLTPVPVYLGLSRVTVDAARYAEIKAALADMAADGTLERLRNAADLEADAEGDDGATTPSSTGIEISPPSR
jgi:polar amino acid transport system substrate-binding protein